MPEDRGLVREIAWREAFPWISLARVARLAMAPRLILLAALGLLLTSGGWRVIGLAYSSSEDLRQLGWAAEDQPWPWQTQIETVPPLLFDGFHPARSPVVQSALWLSQPVRAMFYPGASTVGIPFVPFTYELLCAIWAIAVWALIGGAITRITALALARESRLGAVGGLRFSLAKWPAFFLAPLLPIMGVLFLSLLMGAVYGLIMRFDSGVLIMSIFWPILLGASLVMGILLLGLVFGWALMWPTISVEGTDSFDALSRSYSYTFQRPLYYLFYAIVAGVIGLLAATIVWLLVHWTIQLSFWSASWGSGLRRMEEIVRDANLGNARGAYSVGLSILRFWNGCVLLLGSAYLFSYFWAAATNIYFLLRQKVDGAEPDVVAAEQEEETFILPPLKSEDGVPQVDDRAVTPGA